MANEFKGLPNHSAEYFGDTREFWWHDDQLARLAQAWRLADVRSVLDVGCGVGHWGRVLARALPAEARLTGIDRDDLWVQKAAERSDTAGLGARFDYRVGRAEALPFDDGRFDLVTCQTVLMHVPQPARVLAEMVRVTQPGGLVVTVETNTAATTVVDSVTLDESPETAAELLRFDLMCARGKRRLLEGDNLIGESLPRLLTEAGLGGVEVRLVDRCWALCPPYESPFERAQVSEILDDAERDIYGWDQATTHRYYLAGGGDEFTFSKVWQLGMEQRRRTVAGVRAGQYSRAGGGLFYVAWGRRPLAR
jgi:SAM-dependent methyltransferase